MKTIGDVVVERLSGFIKEKGITQYKLSQLSGVPFPTIKSIMQRRTKDVTLSTIIMLSNGLGISASEFVDDPAFSVEYLDL